MYVILKSVVVFRHKIKLLLLLLISIKILVTNSVNLSK